MSNNKISYAEPGDVPAGKPCYVCEGTKGNPGEQTVPYKEYADNSGRFMYAHPSCLSTPRVSPGTDPLAVTASKEEENIWAFASRFKYVDAASKMNVPVVHEDSTIQQTFPRTTVQGVQPDVRQDVSSAYTPDGKPKNEAM